MSDKYILNKHLKNMLDIFCKNKKRYEMINYLLFIIFILCKVYEFIFTFKPSMLIFTLSKFQLINMTTIDIFCSFLIYRNYVYIKDFENIIEKYGITVYDEWWIFMYDKYE